MKRALTILTLLLPFVLQAQTDSISGSQLPTPNSPIPVTGALMLAGGSAFTFIPEVKQLSVNLRDAVQADGHSKVQFDNYVQYLPAVITPALNLCGVKGKHDFWKMSLLEGGSYLFGAAVLRMAKYCFSVQRPDAAVFNSFPSGHTFTAFTGAEVLRREYGEDYPWLAVAGYAVATLVGAARIYNDRHWLGDVLAGAGLGILSVSLTYWIFD